MNQNRTIFVTFPFGIAARNMICARTIGRLRAKGFKVVIISPVESHKILREFYKDENIILEDYPKYKTFFKGGVNRDAGFLEQAFMGLINSSLDNSAIRYRRRELLFKKRYLRYAIRTFFHKAFAGRYKWSEFFRKLDEKYFPDKLFKELFDKYNPCAVFSPHVQFDFNIVKRAKAENVPSFGQILSIDNLTTKGNIRTKSSYLFVWNDIMKEEAIKYNLYNKENVISIGIPQYDICFNKNIEMSREEFFKELGADPETELLVYASEAGDSPDDREVIDLLLEASEKCEFQKPITILARTHPRDITKPFEKFKNNPKVIINDPHDFENEDPFIDHWYPSLEQIKYLTNLMRHASIVFMMGSTIGLDATGFNKPVISLGFDLLPKPYHKSVRRYYDHFPHQRQWFDTGAFRIATDRENLIKEINRYLVNPKLENEKREDLINRIFYKFDGEVGERMADFINNTLLNYEKNTKLQKRT